MLYLDNTLVSVMGKQEHQSDLAALTKLFQLGAERAISLVTSDVTRREIDKYRHSVRQADVLAVYEQLEKVPVVEAAVLLGVNSYWGEHGGWCSPILESDSQWLRLRELGLDDVDAHHILVALRAGCSAFLTVDVKTILNKRGPIEKEFSIRLQKPSEFLASRR